MHRNSLKTFSEIQDSLRPREKMILLILNDGPLTEREILERTGRTDMNYVRPRCSDMVKLGVLKEIGSELCPVTGKSVRVLEKVKEWEWVHPKQIVAQLKPYEP